MRIEKIHNNILKISKEYTGQKRKDMEEWIKRIGWVLGVSNNNSIHRSPEVHIKFMRRSTFIKSLTPLLQHGTPRCGHLVNLHSNFTAWRSTFSSGFTRRITFSSRIHAKLYLGIFFSSKITNLCFWTLFIVTSTSILQVRAHHESQECIPTRTLTTFSGVSWIPGVFTYAL